MGCVAYLAQVIRPRSVPAGRFGFEPQLYAALLGRPTRRFRRGAASRRSDDRALSAGLEPQAGETTAQGLALGPFHGVMIGEPFIAHVARNCCANKRAQLRGGHGIKLDGLALPLALPSSRKARPPWRKGRVGFPWNSPRRVARGSANPVSASARRDISLTKFGARAVNVSYGFSYIEHPCRPSLIDPVVRPELLPAVEHFAHRFPACRRAPIRRARERKPGVRLQHRPQPLLASRSRPRHRRRESDRARGQRSRSHGCR